jgi:radical SAM protein with 4Fe4S-binding SPASM domain
VIVLKRFKRVYIEITNVCNMDCSFCPHTTRKKEFMNEERFVRILDQIQGYTEHIYFHIMGEPLLHPDLARFLDISNEKGFKVNLTTNGTLIDKMTDILISKPALRLVSISLHSFEGDKPALDSYLDTIFEFVLKAQEKNILCGLRLWNIKDSVENDENRHILKRIEKEFNTLSLQSELNSRGIEVSKGVYLNFAKQFDWPGLGKDLVSEKGFCHGLRDQIGILVDGTVVPCCLDSEGSIALGNINTQDFSSIIESERAKAIYEGFSSRIAVEELCQKCGYRTRFNL